MTMDRHVGEIIEGIYASTEGDDDVALVTRVLNEVRAEERARIVAFLREAADVGSEKAIAWEVAAEQIESWK
jgi:hypothetical protein